MRLALILMVALAGATARGAENQILYANKAECIKWIGRSNVEVDFKASFCSAVQAKYHVGLMQVDAFYVDGRIQHVRYSGASRPVAEAIVRQNTAGQEWKPGGNGKAVEWKRSDGASAWWAPNTLVLQTKEWPGILKRIADERPGARGRGRASAQNGKEN
ncbi:MAG: hypothetical protein NT105_23850 [Verrucomicrobia bacterium]|nr:hypothetical protein [Verrucomicrobiota bacterium]